MANERTAIVTGASKRVGRAVAEALLEDGWAVVAHVHRAGDDAPAGAVAVDAELDRGDCASRIFAAAEGLPPVRLLVNNAARFARDSLDAFDVREFDAHMGVNVRAPALLTEAFARAHDGSSDALIANIIDSKLSAPNPDFLSYTLSKQALAGLTELAARALSRKGIRVNAIAPSLMLRSLGQDEENFAATRAFNPLGRAVEPDDLIAALRYLIEARAVTGQVMTIDGGQRFWSLPRDVQFMETR